jgi:hypothetical protein
MRRMIVDTANLLFRVAAAHGKHAEGDSPAERAGLAMHMALSSLNRYYKKVKPSELTVTFEGGQNWRKAYTRSSECRSGRVYKANRLRNDALQPFFDLMTAFEQLARQHTALVCLSHPSLEGDDLIAGYVQRFAPAGDEVVIVSGDKDFVQLLQYPNVTLLNPDTGTPRTVEEVCGVPDAGYFLFEKCFRGDRGDNVFPALPRVLKRRLLKAYADPYERAQLMNETWTFKDPITGEERVHRVQDLYEENNLLLNLAAQPPAIRALIAEVLDAALAARGRFSFFHFMQFCGKFGLQQLAAHAAEFAELFSCGAQASRAGLPDQRPS